jgi:putative mRNA 3-end processing factor
MAVAREWLGEAATSGPVLLFGYSLGRAQQLQRLCAEAALERVFVTDAIARLNRVVEQYVSCRFDAPTYDADVALGPGDAVVLPSQTKSLAFVDAMVEETGALTAGFSGWAVDSSFRYANDFDRTFVLSDHCDYPELLDLVAAVDPGRVYTHHGAARTLAATLTADLGYPATALVRNQTSLAEF